MLKNAQDTRARRRVIALVFDIANSTQILRESTTPDPLSGQVNAVLDALFDTFSGNNVRMSENSFALLKPPIQTKFLGDGCLVIWDVASCTVDSSRLNRLFLERLVMFSQAINSSSRTDYGPQSRPSNGSVRVAAALGDVHQLVFDQTGVEYLGPCINIASRMEGYCKALSVSAYGFVFDEIDVSGTPFSLVRAKNMQGVGERRILALTDELNRLPGRVYANQFSPVPD